MPTIISGSKALRVGGTGQPQQCHRASRLVASDDVMGSSDRQGSDRACGSMIRRREASEAARDLRPGGRGVAAHRWRALRSGSEPAVAADRGPTCESRPIPSWLRGRYGPGHHGRNDVRLDEFDPVIDQPLQVRFAPPAAPPSGPIPSMYGAGAENRAIVHQSRGVRSGWRPSSATTSASGPPPSRRSRRTAPGIGEAIPTAGGG